MIILIGLAVMCAVVVIILCLNLRKADDSWIETYRKASPDEQNRMIEEKAREELDRMNRTGRG